MLYNNREISLLEYYKLRANEITIQAKKYGCVQVRYYNTRLRTFPLPVPRGYGTRGFLIGVYDNTVQPDWIVEDLVSLIVK